MIRRLAVGVLLLPLLVLLGCGGNLPKGAVAVVGQALVTQDQFATLLDTYQREGRAPDKNKQPAEYHAFEQSVAQYLVVMEVLRQEAPSYKVNVTDAEVQSQVAEIKGMFQGNEQKFEAALTEQKLSLDEFTQSIKDGLLLQQMKAAVTGELTVTEDEAKAYYDAHQADFVQQEARQTRHILIAPVQPPAAGSTVTSVPTQADWDAAKEEAQKVRSEILNGADFASEAEKYSDDASTKNSGGDLGWIIKGQMVPAFEEAVFSLKKGELSEPVKTQYGYHLIQVTDITPARQLSYEEVAEKIKTALLDDKQSKAWQAWLIGKERELGVQYRTGLKPPQNLSGVIPSTSPVSTSGSTSSTSSTTASGTTAK